MSLDKRVKDFQREFFKKKLGSAQGMFEYLDGEIVIKATHLIDSIIECIGWAFPNDCVDTCCKVINYAFGIDTSKWLEDYKKLTEASLTGKEQVKLSDYKPIKETGFYRDRKRSGDEERHA